MIRISGLRAIVTVSVLAGTALSVWALSVEGSGATYKPEYDKIPLEVRAWFKNATLMPGAAKRLNQTNCCDHADRFMTKFEPLPNFDLWFYYVDPGCTEKGCKMAIIPADTIHDDPIPLGKTPEAEAVFKQMQTEGILFIYGGKVVCFWPPQGDG